MSLNDEIGFEDKDLSNYIEDLDGYIDPWPFLEEHCNSLQLDHHSPSKIEESLPNNIGNEETLASINELGNPSSSKCKKGPGELEKKLDHNARERMRRMKLNVSYLTLRSLLPDARRSKKRWSSAKIVEKVLEYIPKVEDEVRKLKELRMMNEAEAIKQSTNNSSSSSNNSVMVNEIKRGEVVIQACMRSNVLSSMLQNLEAEEDLCSISSASTVNFSDQTTVCCTLHLQMNGNYSSGEDYVTVLRRKFISWLL